MPSAKPEPDTANADSAVLKAILERNQHLPGALMPILHEVQDALGFIPADTVGPIAQALNLSRAEVHGVITFYHHFRSEPDLPRVVQVCRAEACQSMGADRLWAHACASAEGAFTLEPVYCLGLCSSSPAISINERVHARVDAAKFDRLVARAGSAA
jgi:formate dehydrogenase subunit gamma